MSRISSSLSFKDSIYSANISQVKFIVISKNNGDSVFFLSVAEYL